MKTLTHVLSKSLEEDILVAKRMIEKKIENIHIESKTEEEDWINQGIALAKNEFLKILDEVLG